MVPSFRGHGYAKILHAKGLQDLAEMGILRYVGSTDIQNQAMIQVFIQNGCKLTSVREQYMPDPERMIVHRPKQMFYKAVVRYQANYLQQRL